MISKTGRILLEAGLCAWLLAGPAGTHAAEPAPAPAPEAEPAGADDADETLVDADALEVLRGFSAFLAAQPRYGFAVEIGFEVVQDNGQKLEFGSARRYTVRRPDRLRIDEVRRADGAREVYFDGNQLAVWVPGDKVYAIAKLQQHRDLDTMVELMRDALDIPMPMSELLRSDPITPIAANMTEAYLVGRETLMGTECQHLAMRNTEIDAELWIATGDKPLLHRLVINYRDLDGEPRFWAQFSNWTLTPDSKDAVFVFKPPAGAERVRFAVRGKDLQPPEETQP
jgi:hypothetical protein